MRPLTEQSTDLVVASNRTVGNNLIRRPPIAATRVQGRVQVRVVRDPDKVFVGDDQESFGIDETLDGLSLIAVDAFVTFASTDGDLEGRVTNVTTPVEMLSTPITIDEGELWAHDAAVPPVIDAPNAIVALGDIITFSIDDAGNAIESPRGYVVILAFGSP